jgi:hypothetical protein
MAAQILANGVRETTRAEATTGARRTWVERPVTDELGTRWVSVELTRVNGQLVEVRS